MKLTIIGCNILRWLNFNTNLWEVLELATLNYLYIVFQTRKFFFGFNHINYARWLTRYYDSLLKLQETHPNLYPEFKDGLFFIKKTNTSFSGISTDLTLEQTIGADAVCQRIGISAMSNLISARQRWAQSHYIRTSEILHLSESLSITKKEYFTEELKPYNIKNTQRLLKRFCPLLKIIWIRLNSTEKKCTILLQEQQQTEKQLNFFCFSRNRYISKIKICIRIYKKDPANIEKPIKKQRVITFATQLKKKWILTIMLDLFGSILVLSSQKKVDMIQVLRYLLTSFTCYFVILMVVCRVFQSLLCQMRSRQESHVHYQSILMLL